MVVIELLSYIVDWVVLIALAAVGVVVGHFKPRDRPFRIDDPSISLPFSGDTVSIATAFIVAVVAPAAIILLLSLILSPRPRRDSRATGLAATTLYRKIWEAHAGILGLALSVVLAWFVASGLKNLLGKPRPNFLARCQPNLSSAALQSVVKGLTRTYTSSGLHDSSICTNNDSGMVHEGLRSFPSGHTTISAAGLVYLTLYLAGTFSVLSTCFTWLPEDRNASRADARPHSRNSDHANGTNGSPRAYVAYENRAPPVLMTIIALVPLATAMFIGASRWFDFQHHGFDIILSFILGTISAYFTYLLYHNPRQSGPAFARLSRERRSAFWTRALPDSRSEAHKRTHSGTSRPRRDLEGGEWVNLRTVSSRRT